MGERESERVGDRERSIARQHRPIPGTALKDFVVSRLRPSVLAPLITTSPFFSFPPQHLPPLITTSPFFSFLLSISLHSLRLRAIRSLAASRSHTRSRPKPQPNLRCR